MDAMILPCKPETPPMKRPTISEISKSADTYAEHNVANSSMPESECKEMLDPDGMNAYNEAVSLHHR